MDPQLLGLDFPLDQEFDLIGQPDLAPLPDRWTHASASGHGLPQLSPLAASSRDAAAGTDGSAGPRWQQHAAGADGAAAAVQADPFEAYIVRPPTWADTSSAESCYQPAGGQASASAHAAGGPPPCATNAHMSTVDGSKTAHTVARGPQQAAEAAAGPAGRAPRRRSTETQRGGRGTVSDGTVGHHIDECRAICVIVLPSKRQREAYVQSRVVVTGNLVI